MTFDLAVEGMAKRAPYGWIVEPFRRHATLVTDANKLKESALLSLSSKGIVSPRTEEGGLGRQAPAERNIGRYWVVEPGDLVVNPMWLIGGGIGVSNTAGAVSPDYRVYRFGSNIYPRYIHHLLRSQPYRDQYRLYTRADTTFDRRVSKVNFHAMPIIVPPLEEQRRIADFLDAETVAIDYLIKLRDEQLNLLNERWQAQLSDAASRLIERYGAIPLRYALLAIQQGWSPQCDDRLAEPGEWGVVKAGCVNGGVFRKEQHKALPEGLEPKLKYHLKRGDLLMSRASGSLDLIGSVAIVPNIDQKLLLCDKVYRLKVNPMHVRAEFAAHMLRTLAVREHIKLGVSGAEGMANNLPTAVVRSCEIPNAPLSEQGRVVATLDADLAIVEAAQLALSKQVELLEERRRTVITAAVTGELDVTTARRVSWGERPGVAVHPAAASEIR